MHHPYEEPLAVRRRVLRAVAIYHGQDTILPLVGLFVILAVKLTHRDTLGVNDVVLSLLLPFLATLIHKRESARQYTV